MMYYRILSLAPSNTEILFALGAGNRMVGITELCDYPMASQHLPKVGSWIRQDDLQAIAKLKPDLILTSMFVPPTVKEWAAQNSVALINLYPQTLEGIYQSIRQVGELVENAEGAERMIEEIKAKLAAIRAKAALLPSHPKVYSEEYHLPPTVAANWVPELIEIAGGIPLSKPGILSYEVTAEQVATFDPDLMVLHWCGFGLAQKPELVKKRQGWSTMRAVQQNALSIIDDTFLNRPGPRIWRGAEILQQIIAQHKIA